MIEWTVILSMLIFSAFFSGMEIAFVTSNKLKIEIDKNYGSFSSLILSRFAKTPWKFISALLLGNNIALVVYGIYMATFLEPILHNILPEKLNSDITILCLQSIIATLIILLTAEFLPKILFRINSNATLKFFAIPAILFYVILYPIVYLFIISSELILKKIFKIKISQQNQIFTPIDVDNFINEFSGDNSDNNEIQQELQMFQNAIDFRDVKLRECMIPRTEIIAVEKNESIQDLTDIFVRTKLSKILIYEDSIDNIIGYVHAYDLFSKPKEILKILRPAVIVPETMFANKLLNIFIEQHKNVAIVVDEFGGTSGMLTLEDMIEEIFGEIEDEFDTDENVEKTISQDEYIFSGRLKIDYLNEKYEIDLPKTDDYETLAGFIIHFHESIPIINEEITIDNFQFTILEASDAKIDMVKLQMNKS